MCVCVCVCVCFITQLGKITIKAGNHQNIAFHSTSLDMSRIVVVVVIVVAVVVNNNNNNNNYYYYYFPICCLRCSSTRRRHSQIGKEDYGPSVFTYPAHRVDVRQHKIPSAAKWENVRII